MAGVKFTNEQQKVIDERSGNLLVSAAAGSGKTAVLSERIVNMILDEDKPIDIDRVLIVTFAKDAAAEMKSRIADKLRKRAASDKGNPRIKRQLALINNAEISTIDSFCNKLVSNHADEIGIDSRVRIASEEELTILRKEAMEVVLDEYFTANPPGFKEFADCFASDGDVDKSLTENISTIYFVAISETSPKEWFAKELERTALTKDELKNADFIKAVKEIENEILDECIHKSDEIIGYIKSTGYYGQYVSILENDKAIYKEIRNACFEDRYDLVNNRKFADNIGIKTYMKKDEAKQQIKNGILEAQIEEQVSKICEDRDRLKKSKIGIFDKYVGCYHKDANFDNQLDELVVTNKNLAILLQMTERFYDVVMEMKKDKAIMDFNDLEHYALNILVDKDGNPTRTALEYQNYYEEIMIDEYQDSSIIQETILNSISKNTATEGTRFMVGDVKQSIYGFRLARPDIFLEKYNSYKDITDVEGPGENNSKVVLSKNFRSRVEVIDSVNSVFEKTMIEKVGGIDYDYRQKLYFGASFYPENKVDDNRTEFLTYDKTQIGEDEECLWDNSGEADAYVMATRIKELVGKHLVYDKDLDKLRPCEYRDIVILLRATKTQDNIIKKVFEKFNIPTHAISKKGYFSAIEIQALINFIQAMGNKSIDIPLYGVLRHPAFGNLTDEELGVVLTGKKSKQLVKTKVLSYIADEKGDENIKEKLSKIMEEIDMFRKMALYKDTGDLILELCNYYNYFEYLFALPSGEQRVANVNLLIDVAREYAASTCTGFYDFVRYIDELKKKELDMGEANLFDDRADVVRIMTMHKSKGLEFPVTFIGRMDKGLSAPGSKASNKITVDNKLGIGGYYTNLTRRSIKNTLMYDAIEAKKSVVNRGEDLRILYVAMTRAREKLIMVGQFDEKLKPGNTVYSPAEILNASNYMKLVYPVAMADKANFIVEDYTRKIMDAREAENKDESDKLEKLLEVKPASNGVETFVYPHTDINMIANKTTVTELKKAAFEDEPEAKELYKFKDKHVPFFVPKEGKEVEGNVRGNAYHRVMQLMDFAGIYDGDIVKKLELDKTNWVKDNFIWDEELKLVSDELIYKFLDTELSKNMSCAAKKNRLYREQPFVIALDSEKVSPDYPAGEKVLLQGVIDAYYIDEDDKIVIVDYKTDKVKSKSELVERYSVQLDYYEKALEMLLHKKVKSRIIYSFALNTVIDV